MSSELYSVQVCHQISESDPDLQVLDSDSRVWGLSSLRLWGVGRWPLTRPHHPRLLLSTPQLTTMLSPDILHSSLPVLSPHLAF